MKKCKQCGAEVTRDSDSPWYLRDACSDWNCELAEAESCGIFNDQNLK